MTEVHLVDTDILIDYLRDHPKAVQFLENLSGETLVSPISVAELYAGIRNENEKNALIDFLQAFRSVPLDNSIAETAGSFKQKYFKSHGVGLADAVIAATAQTEKARLWTLNTKHFPMFDKIEAPYKK